jgi:hypothetical protein
VAIGMIGELPPAIRAARPPITTSHRAGTADPEAHKSEVAEKSGQKTNSVTLGIGPAPRPIDTILR